MGSPPVNWDHLNKKQAGTVGFNNDTRPVTPGMVRRLQADLVDILIKRMSPVATLLGTARTPFQVPSGKGFFRGHKEAEIHYGDSAPAVT